MNDLMEQLADWLVDGNPTTRRRFMLRVARAGFATIAALAGLSTTATRVAAWTQVQCCKLSWVPNYCPGNTCPSGCTCYSWTCCTSGGCQYRCGECDTQHCSYIQQIGPCGGRCPNNPFEAAVGAS